MNNLNISLKVNRILNGFLILIFFLLIRVWYLSIYLHEEKVRAAEKPQRRTSILRADRATIKDRFGNPLAINKVQYNVSLNYGEIQEVPRVVFKIDAEGKKVKFLKRKAYIEDLSKLLQDTLGVDKERVEDIIHAKISTLGKIPFVIKENISEEQYFRLKMIEGAWPGLHADVGAKRVYPCGKVGAEIIGYLGPISRDEFDGITSEMNELEKIVLQASELPAVQMPKGYKTIDDVENRLRDLEKKAYTINDFVGKAGVEKTYDEKLRGSIGKKSFLADVKGNFLNELPNKKEPECGQSIYLTISKELQEYAESLLADYENSELSYNFFPEMGAWIKGGAIVAIDPNTGEVYALASFPRFDPNDFVRDDEQKNAKVLKWIEHENYIGAIWDGKELLSRERFDVKSGNFYEDQMEMTFQNYLDMILQDKAVVKKEIKKIKNIEEVVFVQAKVKELLSYAESSISPLKLFNALYGIEDKNLTLAEKEYLANFVARQEIEQIKRELKIYFQHLPKTHDKLLFVDLLTLVANASFFSPDILQKLKNEKVEQYRQTITHLAKVNYGFRNILKDHFHEAIFKEWRENHFKDYLAERRREEKLKKRKYLKPYIDYLDEAENQLFREFFAKYKIPLITYFITGDASHFDSTCQSFLALLEKYREKILKKELIFDWSASLISLAKTLDKFKCDAYLRTLRSFQELNLPLLGHYSFLREDKGVQLEKHLAGAFYPKYGFGFLKSRAFREKTTIGSIFKLIPAYEAMQQRVEIGETGLNPLTIIDDKHRDDAGNWNVGFTMDRKPIPLIFHGGRLPRSDHASVGQVDVVKALEVSSNPYFALLAGEVIHDATDLCKAAKLFSIGEKTGIDLPGESAGNIPKDVVYNRSGLYAMAIGQHTLQGTPLQVAVMLSAIANHGHILVPRIVLGKKEGDLFKKEPVWERRSISLPQDIRNVLLKGLQQVIQGEKGTARSLKKEFSSEFLSHVVGKTSTAEVMQPISLDSNEGFMKCKDVWFGSIYFGDKSYQHPELVVVVYLRLGEYGWKAAPYAMKMIQKFLEIRDREQ